ncbi:efflux RND transporter periplasmic adaptor subunit [Rubellicoccus peritrichatus]|uniref:Efflux RND transporter periplasmic adaptor subunit n=1 Tax=Rubellicoccus peritrichatus TaxID=3080537 RepID=A0AAQ3LDZ8_9BACT|nr:efflux RND transporter periplasmic adaptor subunit [Puniceicoccus sp. CR14]WOO41833.1 efflux RND transporter periplasmic adaptor subunit [Puniceicoccus sp. CR14]
MKVILPIIVLILAGLISYGIISMKPEPERKEPSPPMAFVEVIEVEASPTQLAVKSQGTVQARTQTTLSAEVSGRILKVSPAFRPGGFFKKGEVLLEIDPADYESELALEKSNLAQAELQLEEEQAQSEQAALDWKDLGRGEPTSLALREPQIRQAQAALESAEARVERAKRDLDRTKVIAPYNGRILEQMVDLGGYVTGNPGTALATIYSTDVAEVRLPVSNEELARLDLPFAYMNEANDVGPKVVLSAEHGGKQYHWDGMIVRTEATIDPRSRLTFIVAEVVDPYVRDPDHPGRPPLKVGMFVKAEIEGFMIDDVVVIPRYALREGNTVLIETADSTLERRNVVVVQSDQETAVIAEGLNDGDQVITSPVEYIVEGMAVKSTSKVKSEDAELAEK